MSFTPLVLEGRWFPGLTVVTDRPALACLASQYAGWRLDRDGYFAMASGPGRALIRAEELYDDLDADESARTAVLCLETRDPPPEPVAELRGRASRCEARRLDAVVRADRERGRRGADCRAGHRDRAAQAPRARFDVRRVVSGFGSCPLPPVAKTDPEAIGRTNDAVLYGGQVELTVDAPDEELEAIVPRMPASASKDHGEPFGSVLERAGWDFYEIDPLLFSPAEVRLTSVSSGRSFHAGAVEIDVLERSFRG